jgi:hypothetical protein
MRQILHLFLLVVFLVSGCVGGSDEQSGKIELNVKNINFCNRPVGETVVWNDVQVRNTSSGVLTISMISVRGDANCSFQVFYPWTSATGKIKTNTAPQEANAKGFDPLLIDRSASILLKVAYTPSALGVLDRADLVIKTDAVNTNENIVIPMCGRGDFPVLYDAGVFDSLDASISSDSSDPEDAGVNVDSSCLSCGKNLKPGAPYCESGY